MTLPEAPAVRPHPALLGTRRWASPRVHALATLRHGAGASAAPFDQFNLGLRAGDAAEAVLRNRAELGHVAALPAAPHWLRQVHGTQVTRCAAEAAASVTTMGSSGRGAAAGGDAEPEADAAVTVESGVVLAVLTADCLPVVLAARDGSVVAVAHAGWRGLAAGVLESTVAAMEAAPGALQAWLGPAAGPSAYEVGAEVREAFLDAAALPGGDGPQLEPAKLEQAFAPTRPGHWLCDLYMLARLRLAMLGVTDVEGGAHCTISEPDRFFSHRRDGRSGRMATLAWIGETRAL